MKFNLTNKLRYSLINNHLDLFNGNDHVFLDKKGNVQPLYDPTGKVSSSLVDISKKILILS